MTTGKSRPIAPVDYPLDSHRKHHYPKQPNHSIFSDRLRRSRVFSRALRTSRLRYSEIIARTP